MIKARKDNKLILGLSDENLRRLKGDEMIKFNLKELGFGDIDVFIFNAPDESKMVDMIYDNIGPDTKIL